MISYNFIVQYIITNSIILYHALEENEKARTKRCGNILGIIFVILGIIFFSMVSIGGGDVSIGGGLSLQRR